MELVWPNFFGTRLEGNSSWLEATRPDWARDMRVWVPSLYLGGLTLVLAAAAVGFRGERPGRGWLTAVALISLLASFGEFTGPLWWARWHPAVAAQVGPHDPPEAVADAIRHDGRLRDGDGGVYWLLATALPGFWRFRYPSKLLTFTALAVAGLAGIGWDRLAAGEGRSRRAATAVAAVLLASPGLLILADTYDPGWRLAVDGAEAPIFRANRMMRAAALGAGRHHLVFRYEPWSFRVGVVVSLASLVALAAALALARR